MSESRECTNSPADDSVPESSLTTGELRARMQRLIRDHHADAYRYAFHLSGSAADADDIVQQAFLIAHQRLGQLQDEAKSRSWLLAIVRTTFLKSIRRRRPTDAGSLELDVGEIPGEIGESPVDEELLHQAMDTLSDDNRLVLLMFYFEEASYKEIAQRLDLPLGTVMSRLSRAKGKLRAALLRQNASLESGPRPTSQGGKS